jgi:hypothetical protein
MSVVQRRYRLLADFQRVCDFYSDNYRLPNWHIAQPAFEYAHVHPYFNDKLSHRFGLWEDEGQIVAFTCFEGDLGDCSFCVKKGYEYLKQNILEYAENQLSKIENGKYSLEVRVTNIQNEDVLLQKNGYTLAGSEPITIYSYEKGFVRKTLPKGFGMISLEDECDFLKIHHCLWKGFDHGPDPDDDLDCRIHAVTSPHFRSDLTTIIKAPNGDYACFAGMWMDNKNGYAYLEPLATMPEYRRLGLATAAFMEAMRKTVPYGAKYCYGGSREFYHAIGCDTVGYTNTWKKVW